MKYRTCFHTRMLRGIIFIAMLLLAALPAVAGPPCSCHGLVTTEENGAPVVGAAVTLYRWAKGGGESIDDTTTDADGVFRFGLKSWGTAYSVYVKKVGYGNRGSGQVKANPGGDVAFTVHLAKADSFIGGTVVDRHGHPISGANVMSNDVDNLNTITNDGGHFRLDGVPEGYCDVTATAPGERYYRRKFQSGRSDVIVPIYSPADIAASSAEMKANLVADPHLHGNGEDAAALLRGTEARAAAAGKTVFLVFGASWCGGCYRLSRLLEQPQFKQIMDAHFVVLELDILEEDKKKRKDWENPGGADIYKKYGGVGSIPFWVFLDPAGRSLGDSIIAGQNEALGSDNKIAEHFLQVVKVVAPNVSVPETETLRQLIRHMDDD